MAQLNFDATQVAPDTGSGDALPAGWYNVMMDESENKPTSKGNGDFYLNCRFNILDGAYAGRKLFTRLNLKNSNPVAQEIGYKQLSAICHAVGVLQVPDSSLLHGKPLKVKIKVRKATDEYEASNDITAFKNINEPTNNIGAADPGAGGMGMPAGFGNAPVQQQQFQPQQQQFQQPQQQQFQQPAAAPAQQFQQPAPQMNPAQQQQQFQQGGVQQPWAGQPGQMLQPAPVQAQPQQQQYQQPAQAPQQQMQQPVPQPVQQMQQQAPVQQQQAWQQPQTQQPWTAAPAGDPTQQQFQQPQQQQQMQPQQQQAAPQQQMQQQPAAVQQFANVAPPWETQPAQ